MVSVAQQNEGEDPNTDRFVEKAYRREHIIWTGAEVHLTE